MEHTGESGISLSEKHSPLHAVHLELGAKFASFGGWSMPLEYSGTIAEHLACRTSAAIFDVSHLGTVRLSDAHAPETVRATLTNDLHKIEPGRAQYTHLLDDDGSVLDDIIIWWHPNGTLDVMPNASNTDAVRHALGGTDITTTRAIIALQGPDWSSVASQLSDELAHLGRFRVTNLEVLGVACTAAGTGYTGERGIELAVPSEHAAEIWNALRAAGATPAGLGARDTLRLEAGLPLHGHELGPGITPFQAGLGWVVSLDSGCRGDRALKAELERGIHRKLVGIATEGRRPPRAGAAVVMSGQSIGIVTSGNFSPTLQHGIALAFVTPDTQVGASVHIDVRGTLLDGKVVTTPFVRN